MKKNISYNRTAIVNQGGQVSSITISRAIEIGTVDENITTASLEEDEDYAIIVADRSLTEEEINWLKQNWDKI